MPARVIKNSRGKNHPKKKQSFKKPQVEIAAPELKSASIEKEMEAMIAQNQSASTFSNADRAQFYAGTERLNLRGSCVQRVRDLQEENDHLQREINAKEDEIAGGADPLALLADIEHRKIIIARNTGEILKIYLRNEERMKRIQQLQDKNSEIQSQMTEMQGRFITTKNMDEKTKFASEFFVLKSEIEQNLNEINELSKS